MDIHRGLVIAQMDRLPFSAMEHLLILYTKGHRQGRQERNTVAPEALVPSTYWENESGDRLMRAEDMCHMMIKSSYIQGKAFPENVFSQDWRYFLLFEPDILFTSNIINFMPMILTDDRDEILFIYNTNAGGLCEESCISITKKTTEREYFDMFLTRRLEGIEWLYRPDAYIFTSNSARWCIYCERSNDIGVIAFRDRGVAAELSKPFAAVGAITAKDLNGAPSGDTSTLSNLTEEWREAISKNYGGAEVGR